MTEQELEKAKLAVEARRRVLAAFAEKCRTRIDELQTMVVGNADGQEVELHFPNLFGAGELSDEAVDALATQLCERLDGVLDSEPMQVAADCVEKTAEQRLEDNGYDPNEIVLLKDESYDSALVGVTDDYRAVYSFPKMIDWLREHNGCSYDEAVEWIDCNTIRALPYAGAKAPVVMFNLDE